MEIASELTDEQKQRESRVGFIDKLLRGEDGRISRIHSRLGGRVKTSRLLFNGPRALASYIALKALGYRPIRPWISYAAAARLQKLLASKRCSVLEFGSGMSTLWFARYAARVHSIENDPRWFELIEPRIKALGKNSCSIEYVLEEDRARYTRFKANSAEPYDIILFDGPWREDCIRNHGSLARTGGVMYLDNSDADSSSGEPGEMRRASEAFRDSVAARHGSVIPFIDFSPTVCFVSEGLMGTVPNHSRS